MRFSTAAVLCAASFVSAKELFPQPFEFPLKNGFPAPSKAGIKKIEQHAGGALPNGALPTKIHPSTALTFQLIAVNEMSEVAFFTELLKNITHDVPGYKLPAADKKYAMRVMRRIRAQEESHTLGAAGLLEATGNSVPKPCQYTFPVTSYKSAIALANIFTDVVISVVPGVQMLLAENGGQDVNLIPLVGSILAQEAEQTGWFRAVQGKAPSAAPFLTGGVAQFAASAIRLFIVPGSCKLPPVPYYPPMTALTAPSGNSDEPVMFEIEGTGVDPSKNSVVFFNGQSLPITAKISKVATKGKMTTFEATLPFKSDILAKGLTYGLLVKGTKKFPDFTTAAAAGMYGPALLEIQ